MLTYGIALNFGPRTDPVSLIIRVILLLVVLVGGPLQKKPKLL